MNRKPQLTLGVRLAQALLFLLGLFTGALAVLVLTVRPFPWAGAAPILLAPVVCFGMVLAAGRDTPRPRPAPPVESEQSPSDPAVWPPPPRRH